ncbi:hypothetical protein E2C01_100943 [Portunus trituberculatus]|uniref:Uncharacterized protein n=1 Tax=Portunus trituberculatus TaxID=210409 RepID=A0A5B7K4F5_PORTR|nr:hypothetical protein [Portunus trituberculatus]
MNIPEESSIHALTRDTHHMTESSPESSNIAAHSSICLSPLPQHKPNNTDDSVESQRKRECQNVQVCDFARFCYL